MAHNLDIDAVDKALSDLRQFIIERAANAPDNQPDEMEAWLQKCSQVSLPVGWTDELEEEISQQWESSPTKARIDSIDDNSSPFLLEAWKRCLQRFECTPETLIGPRYNLRHTSVLDPVWSEEHAQLFTSVLIHPILASQGASTVALLLACTAMCRRNERRSLNIVLKSTDLFLHRISELLRDNIGGHSIQEIHQRAWNDVGKTETPFSAVFDEIESLALPVPAPVVDMDESEEVVIETADLELLSKALKQAAPVAGLPFASDTFHDVLFKAAVPVTPENPPANAAALRSALGTLYKGLFRHGHIRLRSERNSSEQASDQSISDALIADGDDSSGGEEYEDVPGFEAVDNSQGHLQYLDFRIDLPPGPAPDEFERFDEEVDEDGAQAPESPISTHRNRPRSKRGRPRDQDPIFFASTWDRKQPSESSSRGLRERKGQSLAESAFGNIREVTPPPKIDRGSGRPRKYPPGWNAPQPGRPRGRPPKDPENFVRQPKPPSAPRPQGRPRKRQRVQTQQAEQAEQEKEDEQEEVEEQEEEEEE